MSTLITPENNNVWRLRATINKVATTNSDGLSFIPSFDTGQTYVSQFIAVGISVRDSKSNWSFGGYLSQEYKFPSTGYRNNGKAFNRTQDLLVNDVSIIRLPLLSANSYKLRYFPPNYFSDVRLQIWEYQGVEEDLLLKDLADFFREAPPDLLVNLPSIEEKLNQLLPLREKVNAIFDKLDNISCNQPYEPPEDRKERFFIIN